jgi:hypothetical protein
MTMTKLLIAYLDPVGRLVERTFDSSQAQPIVIERPSVPPPADEPWVTNPQGRVTVEQMRAFLRATATASVERDGGTLWWLRKSTEREDWGEHWYEKDGYLGVLEDRSTGLRDCPDGKRRSPEACVRDGFDFRTLPLASYYLRGPNGYPWGVMATDGVFDTGPLRVDYVWSNGDVWPSLPFRIRVEPGHGVVAGYPVFARQTYDKRDGDEFNLWGESGWREHRDTHSGLHVVNRDPAPAFPRGPFVEPRRSRPYPPVFVREAEKVRIKVLDWGPREPTQEPVIAWVRVNVAGASRVTLLVDGAPHESVTLGPDDDPVVMLESSPMHPGSHALVVEARDASGRLLDRTGSPRIVTVLAAPVEPEPEPDRPAGTIQSAHATYLRVRPDGVVDFGGAAPGPWEAVSTEAQ